MDDMELGIAEIKVKARKRKLDESKVRTIADSFAAIGQLQPITVVRDDGMYRLVAGLHRLEAAKRIGWQTIEATIFDGDEVEIELAEIDENLMRNDLTVLEQGEHLVRRQELIGKRPGRYQDSKGITVIPLKTTAELAHDIGLSEISAQKRMQVARNILPEVKELIRDTPIADSTTQLLELARMKPDQQIKVTRQAVEDELSIKDAEKVIRKKEIITERQSIATSGASVPESEKWHVWQADINTWIAPRQYDFIVTDPPYPKEYLPLWETLAIRAKEWLKPGGLLIAMSGQSYLPEIYSVLGKYLDYYWTAAYLTPGQSPSIWNKNVIPKWKPLLIYSVGKYSGKMFGDVYSSGENSKSFHKWGQSESGMFDLISGIVLPGQYILDPFCGAGTTGIAAIKHGCLFDGIDIEIDNVNISKKRLNDTTKAG